MAGKSTSNLGASSSTSTKNKKQEEKRKLCATRAKEAKKQRPFQLNVTARPSGSGTTAAVPAVPLHRAASTSNTAMAFPMAGANGAATLWSTAATLGAASRAAAALPVPVTAGANGPAAPSPAPPSLQPTGAAASVRVPLVLAHVDGQLLSLPLQFAGYQPIARVSGLPTTTPAAGMPLAAALHRIENGTLGRMLSALMPRCNPPLLQHQSKSGTPPPWWPTGTEEWWVPELVAHLDTMPMHTPVPFAPSCSLKKVQKVAVLVAIVKHLAPDFSQIAAEVRLTGKLSVAENNLWNSALYNEQSMCMRPVFILQQGDGGISTPAGAGTGSGSAVVPAADDAVVPTADALGDDGRDQPVNDDEGTRKEGAVVAARTGQHVHQVAAAEPEMEQGQDGGVQGNGVAGAGGEEVHPAADVTEAPNAVAAINEADAQLDDVVEAPNAAAAAIIGEAEAQDQGRHWDELSHMFAEFESFGDAWYFQ